MAKAHLQYEPDRAHLEKHKWSQEYPAIIRNDSGDPVGKCPASFELEDAQRLLDSGIRCWDRGSKSPYPDRVYNVREGVVYRAHRQGKGPYHGFPECAQNVPPKVLRQLRELAEREGCLEQLEDWLNRYNTKEDADDPDDEPGAA